MSAVFELRRPPSPGPLVVSVPHCGTALPKGMAARFTPKAQTLPDTDWHLERVYDFVPDLGGSLLCARFSRYVVDLNRPQDGAQLYPGRFETGLVPTLGFDTSAVYRDALPEADEIQQRVEHYWKPYHQTLDELLQETIARWGFALLLEAHSIRSSVPAFHPKPFPDCMPGDGNGTTCPLAVREALAEPLIQAGFHVVPNHPFRGGYITRKHGAHPHIHAIQLEMAWRIYLDEQNPSHWDGARAAPVVEGLTRSLDALSRWGECLV